MKLFYQLYFIVYKYNYNRNIYLDKKSKYDPDISASGGISSLFLGWFFLLYNIIIKIFSLQVIDKKYGKLLVVLFFTIVFYIIYNYFSNRSDEIYLQCAHQKINKLKIIFLAILFFVIPFLFIILFIL